MSVAEVLSLAVNGSSHPLPLAIFAIVLVVIGGFRWVSQPGLADDARRLVREVVYVGWAVFFSIMVLALTAIVLASLRPAKAEPLKEQASIVQAI